MRSRVRAEQVPFERLARDLSPPLLRYLRRLAGDNAAADDLLQETLLRIARGLNSFEGRASARTWAFSIATHVAADHFRNPAHTRPTVDIADAADVPDPGREIDERLVVDEMNACVRRVIDSLPADYAAALVLHDLEGLSAGQTAEICRCSVATAKIRIHRARNRLRQALRQQCELYRDDENVLRCDSKA